MGPPPRRRASGRTASPAPRPFPAPASSTSRARHARPTPPRLRRTGGRGAVANRRGAVAAHSGPVAICSAALFLRTHSSRACQLQAPRLHRAHNVVIWAQTAKPRTSKLDAGLVVVIIVVALRIYLPGQIPRLVVVCVASPSQHLAMAAKRTQLLGGDPYSCGCRLLRMLATPQGCSPTPSSPKSTHRGLIHRRFYFGDWNGEDAEDTVDRHDLMMST